MNTDKLVHKFFFCSSHVGSRSHCCGCPGSGGMLRLLSFQKMLCEKEKTKESEGEEDRSPQKGPGRRRRGWREGL